MTSANSNSNSKSLKMVFKAIETNADISLLEMMLDSFASDFPTSDAFQDELVFSALIYKNQQAFNFIVKYYQYKLQYFTDKNNTIRAIFDVSHIYGSSLPHISKANLLFCGAIEIPDGFIPYDIDINDTEPDPDPEIVIPSTPVHLMPEELEEHCEYNDNDDEQREYNDNDDDDKVAREISQLVDEACVSSGIPSYQYQTPSPDIYHCTRHIDFSECSWSDNDDEEMQQK